MIAPVEKNYTSTNFWRIVFTYVIALYHFRTRIRGFETHRLFSGWYIGVEFFFIVSGFLLLIHFERKSEQTTFQYFKHRIKRLYPHYLLSLLIAFVFRYFFFTAKTLSFETVLSKGIQSIPELFMLHMSGFGSSHVSILNNAPTWYLSAMIIVSYLFFYLLRNHKKTFLHLIVPFFILFVYGYSLADGQAISSWYSDRGNIRICHALLRTAAAMSVGALCYLAYTKLKEAKLSRAAVIILSMVEFFLYLLVLAVSAKSYAYDVYLVAALAFAVTLSFSLKKHSSLWNCKLIRTFSDISYAIFLNHWLFAVYVFPYVIGSYKGYRLLYTAIYLIVITGFSFATHYLIKFIINRREQRKNKNKKRRS